MAAAASFAGIMGKRSRCRLVCWTVSWKEHEVAKVEVCKLDVEGAELLALRGLAKMPKRSPHLKLLVEYSPGKTAAGEGAHLLDFLRTYFQEIWVVTGRGLRRAEPLPEYCNLWCYN